MEIKPIVYLFSLAGTRLHLWRLHLQSHLVVAANLAGTVDDTLRQGWPVQSVFSAAEPRCPSIMGCATIEYVKDDFSFVGASCHLALPTTFYHALTWHITKSSQCEWKTYMMIRFFFFSPPFIEWNQEAVKCLFFIKKRERLTRQWINYHWWVQEWQRMPREARQEARALDCCACSSSS